MTATCRQRHTGRVQCDGGDETGGKCMQTKELQGLTPTITSEERTKKDSLLHVSKGMWPSRHLDFGPLNLTRLISYFRILRQYIFVV